MLTRLLSSRSLLAQFLVFNLFTFIILGFFTFIYLKAIQPELISKQSNQHLRVIKNIEANLNIQKTKIGSKDLKNFLIKSKFLLDEVDQIRFLSKEGEPLFDSIFLDLDQKVFSKALKIEQSSLKSQAKEEEKILIGNTKQDLSNESFLKKNITRLSDTNNFSESELVKKNFIVHTFSKILLENNEQLIIIISEISNEIMLAVEERKNFVLRSVVVAAVIILIFSIFLNAYIIKPIRELSALANQASPERKKISFVNRIENRDDEIGNLSRSLSEMTSTLYDRIDLAERFASDLTHEIRNPLASLKGASDLLNTTNDKIKRDKLLKIISNDVDRIERLITDYSQVLKDEATQSRSTAKEFDLIPVIEAVVEDFNTDTKTLNKNISIVFKNLSLKQKTAKIFGIESRIEQVIANILENAVSFSPRNKAVTLSISQKNKKVKILVRDKGPGFDEKNVSKIFERFYSDRPDDSSVNHSGLGLNIVKSIIDSHQGSIEAYNFSKTSNSGAVIDIQLPLRK